MEKKILVIAGASGVGKTTVATQLLSSFSEFGFVRSLTTRAPRGDGHDGEYIYVTREQFLKRAEDGEMVEYMEYGTNLYGTPVSELDRIFAEGKIPLLILDIEGVKSLRSKAFDFTPRIVYIWDDINTVERRLYDRDLAKEPSADKLLSFVRRKEMNIRDYLAMPDIYRFFDFFVKNDGVEKCAKEIMAFFEGSEVQNSSQITKNKRIADALADMCKQSNA